MSEHLLSQHRVKWIGAGIALAGIGVIAWLGLARSFAQSTPPTASLPASAMSMSDTSSTEPADDEVDDADASTQPTTGPTNPASTRSATTSRSARNGTDQFGPRSDREQRRGRTRNRTSDRNGRNNFASANSSTNGSSSTQPIENGSLRATTTRPIDDSFSVLRTRSIFTRNHVNPDGRTGRGDGYGAAGSAATRPTRPEDTMIFNGVTDADGSIVAFIEDNSNGGGRIVRVKVGDPIARGKVAQITLEMLDYEVDGQATHVMIGQNLAGVDTVGTASSAGAAPGAGTPDSPGAAPAGPTNDVLERLRRARLEGK